MHLSDADVHRALRIGEWYDVSIDNYRGTIYVAGDFHGDGIETVLVGVIHSAHGPANVNDRMYVLAGIEVDADDWIQVTDFTPFNNWAAATVDERAVMPDDVRAILTSWLDAEGAPLSDSELADARRIFAGGAGYRSPEPGVCGNIGYWTDVEQAHWNRICRPDWPHYTFDTKSGPMTLCARCARENATANFARLASY